MILFGLWHKASLLFLLWGCYHGVLLVLHRQLQHAQRSFNRQVPDKLSIPISWIVTMALVNLGWIFFRANSLPQAGQMLAAAFSPASYVSHVLTGSLYLLVATLAVGYTIALVMIDALDRWSNDEASHASPSPGIIALLARWRWFWLPPLYTLASVFLLIITLTQGASTAQFMYRKF
jgi:alginate O-acetyltransferase complex protein AlgI